VVVSVVVQRMGVGTWRAIPNETWTTLRLSPQTRITDTLVTYGFSSFYRLSIYALYDPPCHCDRTVG